MNAAPQFQRRIEDFICEVCGTLVKGDGYRNHCSKCLTSKHVDVNPGDRAAGCGGLMDVVDVEMDHGDWVLVHQCRVCGHQRKNKTAADDDREVLIQFFKQKQP